MHNSMHLCDVFSQKCSAAWQGARGERLTVAIMLPGRQDADDWLNFMLSQKNLWPTFTTRGTLTEEVSAVDAFMEHYVDVGEPTSHPCSITGMIQDHH